MKKILLSFLFLIISFNLFAFTIAENGSAKAVIVLPSSPNDQEKYAADALKKYIKEISGADLSADTAQKGYNIFIRTDETLQENEISIVCKNNRLDLSGGKKSGVIYAVYTFLEDYLGVKYYTSKEEYIPKKKNIIVNDINYRYTPKAMSREVHFRINQNTPEYSLKVKLNGNFCSVPEKLGGHNEILGFVHTFCKIMDPEKYGKDHPEWFGLVNGERTTAGGLYGGQPCMTNKKMTEEMKKNTLKWIDENPNCSIVSVSQNDTPAFCECENCKASYEKYGYSGTLLNLVNQVADTVKEKYPEKFVETLAYNKTLEVPKGGIVPRDNVIVRISSIRCDFGKKFTEKENETFYNTLTAWSKIAKNIFVWDYVVNFKNFLIIHPNFRVLQPNVKTMTDNNAVSIYEQADGFNYNSFMYEYKAYILAKLLWNPDLDFKKETKGFMDFMYGPAGKDFIDLIDYLEVVMEKCPHPIHCVSTTYNNYFTDENWTEICKYLQKALQHAKSTEYYDKVKFQAYCAYSGLMYEPKSLTDQVLKYMPFESYDEYLNDMVTFLPEHGIQYNKEHDNHWRKSPYVKMTETKTSVPKECEGLPQEKWVQFGPENFSLGHWASYAYKIVEDPKASTGKAIWLDPYKVNTGLQHFFDELFFRQKYTKAKIYLTYRVENSQGRDCFTFGVSDDKNFHIEPSGNFGKNFSGDDYITEYMGEADIEKRDIGTFLYFNEIFKEPIPEKVYIDKVFAIFDN